MRQLLARMTVRGASPQLRLPLVGCDICNPSAIGRPLRVRGREYWRSGDETSRQCSPPNIARGSKIGDRCANLGFRDIPTYPVPIAFGVALNELKCKSFMVGGSDKGAFVADIFGGRTRSYIPNSSQVPCGDGAFLR